MKKLIVLLALLASSLSLPAMAQDMSSGADNFYKREKGIQRKVIFRNQYQMRVVGNPFMPKGMDKNTKHSAIIVGHPMGAVKEQSANLYAQKMAEQGFVTLTFDLSFWGESAGQPRNAVSPTVHVEDFSAFEDIETISPRSILFISGDQARSREFSEDAYERAASLKNLSGWKVRGTSISMTV